MFNFFHPKNYLIDQLEGFIDIHNHLLPGIDDGAPNIENTMILIKEFSNLGITNFIATPHIMKDYYGNSIQTIKSAHALVVEHLKTSSFKDVSINFAAEYMLDSQLEELLEQNQILSLKNNYLLFEMSYFQAPLNLNEVTFKMFTKGYIPILAHPERYPFFHSKFHQYEQLKAQGIPFQLNALSLSNHYGNPVKKTALQLLDKGMIDFLATDTHRLQHLQKLKEIKITKKQMNLLTPIIERTKHTFLG